MARIISCWKFNEGTGTIVEDSSGSNDSGKLNSSLDLSHLCRLIVKNQGLV